MFGMGFSELLLIAVIAILFLGPDKLPSTMVEIAKFFRSMKQTVSSVKESINEEIHLDEIKREAMEYKQKLLEAEAQINTTVSTSRLNDEINSLIEDDDEPPHKPEKPLKPAYEKPTFVKKSNETSTDETETIDEENPETKEKKDV